MGKETIKLSDFIKEAIKVFDLDASDFEDQEETAYKCSKCGTKYSEHEKFCSKDGAKIEPYTFKYTPKEVKSNIISLLYDLSEMEDQDDWGYKAIDNIEKRGDGSGYYLNMIFQRKSDEKYFYYTSYDGRIEEDTLDECEKIVTTSWDFERYFD